MPIKIVRISMIGLSRALLASRPTLTVADEEKWYCLYLMQRANTDFDSVRVIEVGFAELHGYSGTPYVDHAPNPAAVEWLAEAKGWHLDAVALELIEGRWRLTTYRGD